MKDSLFDEDTSWAKEWIGMPSFSQNQVKSLREIKLNFRTREDIEKFEKLIGQKITPLCNTYWFPKLGIKSHSTAVFVDSDES